MKLLVISSLVFFTNFLYNTRNKEYPYAWLFLLLTSTSVLVHSKIFYEPIYLPEILGYSIHDIICIIDKIVIASIVIYGFSLFWKTRLVKETSDIPMITFLSVCYLYIGGYFQNKYCFDNDSQVANISHACLHILSSIGHHVIMYEYGTLQLMRKILLFGLFS
jgi:hypothetical protein